MPWVIILFLSIVACKEQKSVVDYAPLTEEEVKCILKNVKPIDENSSEINEEFVVVLDGKYYNWAGPEFQKCLKDL